MSMASRVSSTAGGRGGTSNLPHRLWGQQGPLSQAALPLARGEACPAGQFWYQWPGGGGMGKGRARRLRMRSPVAEHTVGFRGLWGRLGRPEQ